MRETRGSEVVHRCRGPGTGIKEEVGVEEEGSSGVIASVVVDRRGGEREGGLREWRKGETGMY